MGTQGFGTEMGASAKRVAKGKAAGQPFEGDSGKFLSRSRLADFQTHCHPMNILGTCARQSSRCLRAYLGLIGEMGQGQVWEPTRSFWGLNPDCVAMRLVGVT